MIPVDWVFAFVGWNYLRDVGTYSRVIILLKHSQMKYNNPRHVRMCLFLHCRLRGSLLEIQRL